MNDAQTLNPAGQSPAGPYYFDFNATCPMWPQVVQFLQNAPWGNPSSLHASGRTAAAVVHATAQFILDKLGLAATHRVIFHSGATEGLLTLILGKLHAEQHQSGVGAYLLLGGGDHRAIYDLKHNLFLGLPADHVKSLPLGTQGEFQAETALAWMSATQNAPVVLTYTLVNPETGVVWDSATAAQLKKSVGRRLTIIADATQLLGKVPLAPLAPEIDAYVFSGHKFGAMPGTGFSCVRQDLGWDVFLTGAGQQGGWRGGTENVAGIASLKIAFEACATIDYADALKARCFLEDALAKSYPATRGPWRLIAPQAPKALNTISFLDHDPNFLLAYLDQHQIFASLGSACSASLAVPSPTLLQMGMGEDEAKQLVRLSFPPLTTALATEYAQVLAKAWPPV